MFKSLLLGSLAGVWFFTLVFGSAPASAQTTIEIAQAVTLQPQELQQMARIIKQLQAIEVATQEKMTKAVQGVGLTPEKFMAIAEQKNAEGKNTTNVSATDEGKFNQALPQIKKTLEDAQGQQEQLLKKEGLTIEKFNTTMEILVKNPTLQQEVEKLLTK